MAKEIPLIKKIFDPKMFFYDVLKWSAALLVFLDLRLKKIFLTKEKRKIFQGKYLISANHSSFEDPVIISAAFWRRRVAFVATKELFNTKFKKWFFSAIGCVEVDKQNVCVKTFKNVCSVLDRGHIVGVFPEGTVDVDSEEHKTFKSGIVMMALMSEADIVPTYIDKRKNRFHRQRVYIGERIKIKDHISGPFPTIDEIENLTKYLQKIETELAETANEYKGAK